MLPWIGFTAFVLLMLALDLGVFQRRPHVIGMKEAMAWFVTWTGLALLFAAAARGLWIRAQWGLRLALGGLAVNLAADVVNAVIRHDPRTLIGIPIVGLILVYLSRASIRRQFAVGEEP